MKTIIIILTLIFSGVASYSQQDAQFTQYMYNTINFNPAYAGSRGTLNTFALHRTQWVGLDGAPVTNIISINTPLNLSNLGLGVSLINDKIGPTKENNLSTDLSYTIRTSDTFKLSFGIKATLNMFDLDVSKLNPVDATDLSIQNLNNKMSPNIGAGIYWYSDNVYVGFSVPRFIESSRYNDNEYVVYKEKMTYYLMAGYVYELTDSVKIKPALLTKMVPGAPLQVDVSGNFIFIDKFVVGLAYRWSAAMSTMAGFQVSNAMYIGYGYDYETTSLKNYNKGSHEIFLRYELFNNINKITSPRFF